MRPHKSTWINGTLYGAALLGTIWAQMHGLRTMEYVCKPLLMAVLSSWFYFNSRRVGDRFTLLIQAGLFFALVGDVMLMLAHRDQFLFLVGLGAFLMTQLCYTFAFAQNIADNHAGSGVLVSWVLAVGIGAFGFFFGWGLLPLVEDAMALPVGAYLTAITAMGVAAGFRYRRTFPRSFLLVLVGALLFIASDAVLATDRFVRNVPHADWSIMLTYGIGQFLIAAGCLLHVLDPDEVRRKAVLRA
ncbi:MAG: lysoplasmalogenase [Flavobacteriales bacterium]|jgi:uncharacterized membrane protein YhhN|nr:lysoplasmalogenase [Flavobacteriales bacterium]